MFSARRKPKRVVSHTLNEDEEDQKDHGSITRRPAPTPRTQSRLRTTIDVDDAEDTSEVQRTVIKPKIGRSLLSQRLPSRQATPLDVEQRPNYDKSYLEELRNSTPTTPRDLSAHVSDEEAVLGQDLNLNAKFGNDSVLPSMTAIPSAAEIAERKDRRARLAKEQQTRDYAEDFISLDDYHSDGEFKPQRLQVNTYVNEPKREKDTRLVPEDEDIAEGFDEFVDDGGGNRILMSRINQQKAYQTERQHLREMIDDAENGASEGDQSDSDEELHHAYELAQTGRGMDGLSTKKRSERAAKRPKQPEQTTALPSLAAGLERLQELKRQAELTRAASLERIEEIIQRQADVEMEKDRIQKALQEMSEQLLESQGREMKTQKIGVEERSLDSISDTVMV